MKNHLWTRAIFEGYQYLKKIIRILDKQVISMSVHSYQGYQTGADATLQLMQEILELIERKKSLLRLKKIIEEVLRSIPRASAVILVRRHIDGLTLKDVANEQNLSYGVMRRLYKQAIQQAYIRFCALGLSVSQMEQEYGREKWLIGFLNDDTKKRKSKNNLTLSHVATYCQKSNSSLPFCCSL